MKKVIVLIVLAALLTSCVTPVRIAISPQYARRGSERIAVLPFTVMQNGLVISIDVFGADLMAIALMEVGYVVVERTMLEYLIKEQELSLSDPFSEDTIRRIGKLLDVDHIVLGSITMSVGPGGPSSYRKTSIKLVSVHTGEVVVAAYSDMVDVKALADQMKKELALTQ